MAEPVSSMSVYSASDELTDPYCDPCFKDGKNHSVAGYCPKCVEFYCQRCLAAHRRMAATERHTILIGIAMPACQADKPVKYQLCDKHDGEGKDRYCFDHSITICGTCASREHKHCKVTIVSLACKSFKISDEKRAFSADVDLLLKHVKETSQSVESNKSRLEQKKQTILTEAQARRDELLDKINQGYQDFSGKVSSLFKDHITNLSARQSQLDEIATKIDSILHSLQLSGRTKRDDQKEFLELQYSAEKIRLFEDMIKLLNLEHIDISCILKTDIRLLDLTKNKFGKVSLRTTSFQYSTEFPSIHYPYTESRQGPDKTVPETGAIGENAVQSLKLTSLDKINVKISDDKENCLISGVDITVDGNMLLADNDNGKVKLFTPDGILLSFLKPPDKPMDVTVIKKSEAAASMWNKQIGIIDIADNNQLDLKRTITTQQYVGGITAYNSNLIVICKTSNESPRSVQMIELEGRILWTTTTDADGKHLFDQARFLKTCSSNTGDTVFVTDQEKSTITVLEACTGKVVKVFSVKDKKPHGLAVDENGNVFVCYRSGEIDLWSRGLHKQTRLTTESKYVRSPCVLAYNSRRSELVLTSRAPHTEYLDFVHRYKIDVS